MQTPATRTALLAGTLVVATLAAYVPAMRGGFVWDDDADVTQNTTLRSPDGAAAHLARALQIDPGYAEARENPDLVRRLRDGGP